MKSTDVADVLTVLHEWSRDHAAEADRIKQATAAFERVIIEVSAIQRIIRKPYTDEFIAMLRRTNLSFRMILPT